MRNRTKFLKLPFQFNSTKLVSDLSLILDDKWISHFNTAGYNGNWKAIPLYAQNGDESNIFAHPTADSVVSETLILKKCHYLKEVINTFKAPILTARILRLDVGAEIKPHRDHELGYEDGCFRLHIPIVTNPDVEFILDYTPLKMQVGECWYTNVNYLHSVKNLGTINRVHLVLDFERNKWSDELFFGLAPEESFLPLPKETESPETIKRMIEELRLSKEPIAEELINQLLQK